MKSEMEMKNMLLETRGKAVYYKVAKNLAELCSNVLQKIEFVRNGSIGKKVSEQRIEGVVWVLLITYS